MIQLRDCRYRDIREGDSYTEYIDPSRECLHARKKIGDNSKFLYLRCIKCGDIREVINPEYIPIFIKNYEKKKEQKKSKLPEPLKLDAVDRYHAQKSVENYEGDLKKDLLQPYNPDGTPNKEFEREYGYIPE